MFRSMFRVLVVAVVVLGLAVSVVPNAQAAPSKAPAVKADAGWVQAAAAWLTGVLSPKPAPKRNQKSMSGMAATNGPCVDPLGHERPCS